MTAKPLLSGLILAVLCTKALAEEPKLQLIDAEKALSDRFGLSTKPVERRDECLPLDSGGGGMRARKVPCEIFEVIRNVEVARTISVDYDKSVTSLPYAREIDSRNIENCSEIEYKHPPEDREYKVKEISALSFSETLTNVKDYKSSFNAAISYGGASLGGSESANFTVTYVIGSNRAETTEKETTIKRHIEFTVPAWVKYRFSLLEERRSADIPVRVTVLLNADRMQEFRALAGNVAGTRLVKKLNDPETEDRRKFTLRGLLRLEGSDRNLSVKISSTRCDQTPRSEPTRQ